MDTNSLTRHLLKRSKNVYNNILLASNQRTSSSSSSTTSPMEQVMELAKRCHGGGDDSWGQVLVVLGMQEQEDHPY